MSTVVVVRTISTECGELEIGRCTGCGDLDVVSGSTACCTYCGTTGGVAR